MLDSQSQFLKFAFSYAFRSLWRNKRRTVLTILTVTLSVVVSIVAQRYATALIKLWQDGAADTGSAHAQIHAKGYWQEPEGVRRALTLPEGSPVEKKLTADEEVEAFSRRLKFEGIIAAGDKSIYFLGIGVDPEGEVKVSPRLFNPAHDQGSFVSSAEPSAITVGKGLAETLNLRVGSEATLVTQTVEGSVNGIDVIIRGIVDVPLPSFSKRMVYTHVSHAQRLLRLGERYTELAIRLKHPGKAQSWVDDAEPFVSQNGAELRGWWEIEPIIRRVENIFDSVLGLICFLLFVSASISVLNIIFMLVAERTIEIGTLMAIGARPSDIKTLFSLEASLIGFLGGLVGAILGNITVVGMYFVGVPFESPFGSGVVVVRPINHFGVTFVVFVAAILICYLSALAPARKASRVEPVKAFRGQLT